MMCFRRFKNMALTYMGKQSPKEQFWGGNRLFPT
jgi:hypothetical protein